MKKILPLMLGITIVLSTSCTPNKCSSCRGVGKTYYKKTFIVCPACKGKG